MSPLLIGALTFLVACAGLGLAAGALTRNTLAATTRSRARGWLALALALALRRSR